MSFDAIRSGSVIAYPYLWHRQSLDGETEGRKSRPTAVGVRLPSPRGDRLLLFPITSQAPSPDRLAVEIPETEKRRAGLQPELRLWIIIDEYNEDIIGRSFHLAPQPPLGTLSKAFFLPVHCLACPGEACRPIGFVTPPLAFPVPLRRPFPWLPESGA